MGRPGPETRLVEKMRKAALAKYGDRLEQINYHGSAYSQGGVSDLLCCLDGVFVACEVKAPESYPVKGKPSIEKALAEGPSVRQRAFVARVIAAGGTAGFAASVEQYMEILACAAGVPCGEDRCLGHNT